MPAFMVFIREKTLDQPELEAYWDKIRARRLGRSPDQNILAAYGRPCDAGRTGSRRCGRCRISHASKKPAAWYDSPAYQEVAQHRFQRGDLSRPDCRRCLVFFLS